MTEAPHPTWLRDLLLLAAALVLLSAPHLGRQALWEPDEARYAEISREMAVSGDWLTPRVDGILYCEKPPLVYWLGAAAIRLAGPHEGAARAPLLLFALLGVTAVYAAGRRLFGRATGLWAAAVLATCPLYFGLGQVLILDLPLSALLTAALLAFLAATRETGWRQRWLLWGFFAAAALATLTKGLIGIVLPGLVIGLWILVTRQWRLLRLAFQPTGILLFLAIAAPWHLLMTREHPGFAQFYFVHEHFQRYLTKVHQRYEPVWFFLPVLAGGLLPWTVFLPQALVRPLRGEGRREALFLLVWAAVVIGFFSLSSSKLIPYVLPAVPPLALLVGRWLATLDDPRRLRPGLTALLIVGVVAAAVFFWPHPPGGEKGRLYADLLGGFRPAIGACFLLLGLLPFLLRGRRAALGVIAGSALLLSVLFASLPRFDGLRSVEPLTRGLRLQPDDTVATFRYYYHGLPFYLGRRITIAAYTGELDFGTRQEDTRAWTIDEAELWRRWQGPGRVYLVTDGRHLPPEVAAARELARSGKLFVLANR